MKKIKHTTIEVPIYNCNVQLYYGSDDDEDWLKWIYEREDERRNEQFESILTSSNCTFTLMQPNGWMEFVFLMRDTSHGKIAHEIKHLVNFIFGYIGMQLDADNDEAECYLVEWLTEEIYTIINKI